MLSFINLVIFLLLLKTCIFAWPGKYDDENELLPEVLRQPKLDPSICTLSKSTITEIRGYQSIVDTLKAELNKPPWQNRTYNDLSDFVYTIGPRVTGSASVIRAANYFKGLMLKYNFTNVRKEPFTTIGWISGDESATMIKPRIKTLSIIGSNTVNTGPNGIEAPVFVLRHLEDFSDGTSETLDGIVLLNFKVRARSYDSEDGYLASKYIFSLTEMAVQRGARAVLVRSTAGLSIYSPHFRIGTQYTSQIPLAAIAIEDADLIDRLSLAGEEVVINIKRENFSIVNSSKSYNVIGEYLGSEIPNESVIVSGHLDNVPVGLGVQDDGIALMLSLNTVRLLMNLNLRPRRTITTILWGSEELGGDYDVNVFVKKHEKEIKSGSYVAAMEADHGCFGVLGYLASGPTAFRCVLYKILTLFMSNYAVFNVQNYSTDVDTFYQYGVPFADLNGNGDGRYRWFYHSRADTINAVDPKEVDECLAVYAATAYILADMKSLPFRN